MKKWFSMDRRGDWTADWLASHWPQVTSHWPLGRAASRKPQFQLVGVEHWRVRPELAQCQLKEDHLAHLIMGTVFLFVGLVSETGHRRGLGALSK